MIIEEMKRTQLIYKYKHFSFLTPMLAKKGVRVERCPLSLSLSLKSKHRRERGGRGGGSPTPLKKK